MKLSQVFERIGVVADEKARRRVNVSDRAAAITAAEIEGGVSIERLTEIGVPVFKYSTQLTIHGRLPDFEESTVGGYKSIFRNDNGSLGVRYVAVDAAKKALIVRACRSSGEKLWRAHIDSKGLSVYGFFEERDACIAAFRTFPRDLIVGSLCAGAGALGGYYVIVDVGAIYEKDLWPFIAKLWAFNSEADLVAVETAAQARYDAQRAEQEERSARQREEFAAKKRQIASSLGLKKAATVPSGEGFFVWVKGGQFLPPEARLIMLKRRGPALCYASTSFRPGRTSFDAPAKMRKFDSSMKSALAAAVADGFVFTL